MESFINKNDYLSANRGKIAERNAAQCPWFTSLDMRIAQEIPDLWGMGRFQVSLDILNVLNLLNSDWGYEQYTSWYYQIVDLKGTTADNKPVYSFTAPTTNVPWTPTYSTSRWAMQLGVRYSF